jgi:opacity protein-like surface antigen
MRKLLAVVAIAMLGAASSAEAQDTGLSVSARAGYAFPMGEVAADADLGDLVDGNVPVGLEVGFRFARALEIGGYFEYGWGREADVVSDAGVDVTTMRLGAQLNYLLAPEADLMPYVGFGFGWTKLEVDFDGVSGFGFSDDVSGFDFTLQAGAQWRVAPAFSVGPYVGLIVGQFTDDEIEDKGWHEWLQIGLRGTFDLM